MRASETFGKRGSQFGKIAVVTGLHLVVGMAMISMNTIIKRVAPPDELVVTHVPAPKVKAPEPVPAVDPPPAMPPMTIPMPVVETTTFDTALPTITAIPAVTPVAPATGTTGGASGQGTTPAVEPAKKAVFSAALANASDCALPAYPPRAARNGEEGVVTLALLIGTDGKVSDAKVQRSSGFRDLDRAAIAALSMCKFKPATANGVAQPAWGNIAYAWKLD